MNKKIKCSNIEKFKSKKIFFDIGKNLIKDNEKEFDNLSNYIIIRKGEIDFSKILGF